MTLSKNQLKLITSLSQKKYRLKHNLFIAEGIKVVDEFLNSDYELSHLFLTDNSLFTNVEERTLISEVELKKISSLKSPNKVFALFKIPNVIIKNDAGLIVVLDGINDPGNLGTIIRLCDWFGINQLVCSKNTVDCFNTKVVQASMGSLTRVAVNYTDLIEYLRNTNLPVFATDMKGDIVYKQELPKDAILILGNEANGIGEELLKLADYKVSIPRFGNLQQTESLNVATATAILLSEFKRTEI